MSRNFVRGNIPGLLLGAGLPGLLALPARAQDEFPLYNRRPYLQSLSSTSVVIVSQTKAAVKARLRLSLDPSLDPPNIVEEEVPGHDHVFRLDGLQPATTYHYDVTHEGNAPFPQASFRTLPGPESEFRFAAIGDSGTKSEAQLIIAVQLLALDPPVLLHLGDTVYPYGAPTFYQEKFIVIYRDLLARTCVYPALGNHDCQRDRAYWDYLFHTPANNPAGDEGYYSFDAGDAHFAALNSCDETIPEEQIAWLDADLGQAARKWKVVFFHHPPYSNGRHGPTLAVREAVVPVLDRHAVDLVLCGHEHLYERSYPLRESTIQSGFQEPDYVSPGGTIYVVSGGGGAFLYEFNETPDSHLSAVLHEEHNFLDVRITSTEIEVKAIGLQDQVLDRFTIRKAEAPPPLRFIRGDANEDLDVNLSDAVKVLVYLFSGDREACVAASDADASGTVAITDPILILNHLFQGGGPLAAPFPECGEGAGAAATGCLRSCL